MDGYCVLYISIVTSYVDAACCIRNYSLQQSFYERSKSMSLHPLVSLHLSIVLFLYVGARDLAGEASLDLVLQTGD